MIFVFLFHTSYLWVVDFFGQFSLQLLKLKIFFFNVKCCLDKDVRVPTDLVAFL